MNQSINGASMRQMSISECFKKAKLSTYKMKNQINVSSFPLQIDSDSDTETALLDLHDPIRKTPIKLENSKIPSQNPNKKNKKSSRKKAISKSRAKISPKKETTNKIFSNVSSKQYLKSLLSPEENELLNNLKKLTSDHQMLLLKLYSEKFDWHNVNEFCNKNHIHINNEKNMFEFLKEENFIDIVYTNDLQDMHELLDKLDQKQLKEIIKLCKITCKKYSHQSMVDSIAFASINHQTTLTGQLYKDVIMEEVRKKVGFSIKLETNAYKHLNNIYILETLFNSNIKSVKDYIKIINSKLPKVALDDDFNIFSSRDSFLSYIKSKTLEHELQNIFSSTNSRTQKSLAIRDFGEEIYNTLIRMDEIAPYTNQFTDQYIYINLLTECIDKIYTKESGHPLEVKKWLEFLIEHYPNCKKLGQWYYKLIWIYMRHFDVIDFKSAARLLVIAFSSKSDILSDKDKYYLGYLGEILKLNKTQQQQINEIFYEMITEMAPKLIDSTLWPQEVFISEINIRSKINKESGLTNLEQVALSYYKDNGYLEGTSFGILLNWLFVSYFWDIIYNPIGNPPGVFISDIQTVPLDFYSEHFYGNRKNVIDKRLKCLEKWSKKEFIEFGVKNYKESCLYDYCSEILCNNNNYATQNILNDDKVFEDLVGIIGQKVLGKIFERLIKNNLSDSIVGIPNLLIWDAKRQLYKFVVVKNAKTKLCVEKLMWLRYLDDIGARFQIFNVQNPSKKPNQIPVKVELFEEDDDEESYESSINED